MKKVAILGTVGVPACYGGFETMVENILGDNCSPDVEYTIFCSASNYKEKLTTYKGAKLVYLPFKANGVQSMIFDSVSILKSIKGFDTVVMLGVNFTFLFPIFKLFSKSKLIANIDGVEWKRDKWGTFTKKLIRASENTAKKYADVIIADNNGIVKNIEEKYQHKSVMIAYGGDHVMRELSQEQVDEYLTKYGVKSKEYSMSLCRIEPENNCEMILKAYAQNGLPLIFVGNWSRSAYGQRLQDTYSKYDNIKILPAIYELDELYALRSNCKYYLHGHSVGGTNPSLVEAMFCKCNILCYDVIYNKESTEYKANYFTDSESLSALVTGNESVCNNAQVMYDIAFESYRWKVIAQRYEKLY